jgi:FkbM family methyltransferase
MIDLVVRILGRTLSWRIGRALYMAARGEGANDMAANGEPELIVRAARAWHKQRGPAPAVVVDCGANLGDWTAMALDAFAAEAIPVHVHAFEPTPGSREALNRRFGARDNVSIHDVALSDYDGTASFRIVSATGGTNGLASTGDTNTIEVSVRRAEGWATAVGINHIALMKIDTEGHDYGVIAGLGGLLAARAVSVIQFEYNQRWLETRRSLRDIFALAAEHGYHVGRANRDTIDVYDGWNAENDRFFEWNYLLIAPEMLDALDARKVRWGPSNTLVSA